MSTIQPDLIAEIRRSSRELVRELGLLQPGAAGTDLSISAVHAILEIGAAYHAATEWPQKKPPE